MQDQVGRDSERSSSSAVAEGGPGIRGADEEQRPQGASAESLRAERLRHWAVHRRQ